MNFRLKDFLAIIAVTVLSFPVLYILMLYLNGGIRIELGPKDEEKKESVEILKQSSRKDSIAIANSKTFQAMQKEREEIQNERNRLIQQQTRIDLFQKELEQQQNELVQKRLDLEKLVSQSDTLELKKNREISKMYGAMRPAEAAQILETMQDNMAAKIIRGINDDRQKAKILSLLSTDKATRITGIIGNNR